MGGFFGVIHGGQLVQPLIGNRYNAYIGIDGTEGIIGRLGACFCERIKKCTFSYIRKSDDT